MTTPDQPVTKPNDDQEQQQEQELAVTAEIPETISASAAIRVQLPRVTIKYCTQCRWMLRAAYFAQELLSTFSTTLAEVALIPTTGGIFTVTILHASDADFTSQETLLWDRKLHGGFPETKRLKALVRNIVDPSRDLGHIDRALTKEKDKNSKQDEGRTEPASASASAPVQSESVTGGGKEACADCS